LERDLGVDRNPTQRIEHPALLLTPSDDGRRRGGQIVDRDAPEIESVSLHSSAAVVLRELIARDCEQEGTKARIFAEPRHRLDAAQEGLLDQIVVRAVGLGPKKARDRLKVTIEEGLTGASIPGGPRPKQPRVGHPKSVSRAERTRSRVPTDPPLSTACSPPPPHHGRAALARRCTSAPRPVR